MQRQRNATRDPAHDGAQRPFDQPVPLARRFVCWVPDQVPLRFT
jgi:hypothetical protein